MTEIRIDQERCKGCDLCLNLCPKEVFQETKNIGPKGFKLREPVLLEKCNDCGLCQYFCPDAAIILNNKECLIDEFWRKAREIKELAIIQNQARGGWKKVKTLFPGRHFIDGNTACVWAAFDAGCYLFLGYPITPANEWSFEAAELAPKFGRIFLQAENEDAAIAGLGGGSLAGVKVMTATSGPGFSRMQENLSFALTNELPMVIVDVQRTGPSTGRPTATGAGEIRESRWGSHGGTEHIVLYASTVQDTYFKTIEAFNLAEKHRIPVILMMEESVAHLQEGIEIPEELDVFDRIYKPGAPAFGPTADGSSPSMPRFGEGELFKVTGLTHSQWGVPDPNNPQMHEEMVNWQREKIVSKIEELTEVEEYLLEDAEVMVVTYGHTARAVKWAVNKAREKGKKVGMLKLKTLYPFPEKVIEKWSGCVRCIAVPEMNQGQLFYVVRESSRVPVISLPQPDGENIDPRRILKFLESDLTRYYCQSPAITVPTFYAPQQWQREKKEISEESFSPETIYCPGCGLGILRNSFLAAVKEMDLDIQKVVVVSGIGCTSRLPNHLPFDSVNGTHGWPVAFATGIKLGRPDINVVVFSGDGDLFDIGAGQTIHGAKRNIPMVVICFNNFNFGMTGGQVASTTPFGAKTSTTPLGNKQNPFDLVKLMFASGAEFVARCPISKPVLLKQYIKEALLSNKFAFIEVISPCFAQYGRRNKLGAPAATQEMLNKVYVSKNKVGNLSYRTLEERFRFGFPFRDASKEVGAEELLHLVYGKFSSLAEYMSFTPFDKSLSESNSDKHKEEKK